MCVIVHQPAGKRLVKRDAKALWLENPDGGGIAYPHGKRVVVVKAMTFEEWWREYRLIIHRHPKVDVLLHLRIATHGGVDLDNVHPFYVGDNEQTVVAHNGVIYDCVPAHWESRSDTRVFVEDALPRLPAAWIDDEYLSAMVAGWVSPSRLMFLTVDPAHSGTVYRFGRWESYRGLWLSNTYGLPITPLPTTGGKWKSPTTGDLAGIGNEYKWGSKRSKSFTPTTAPRTLADIEADLDTPGLSDEDEDALYAEWLALESGGFYGGDDWK
jgi:glutamine amidotransferase